jgi:hypothetical protein
LKVNPKVHLEAQKTANSSDNTEKKSNAGGINTQYSERVEEGANAVYICVQMEK